jgi:hypothetical protein
MPFDLPHAALGGLWLFWLGQAAWSCYNVRKYHERGDRLLRRRDRSGGGPFQPPAAVIVPVKGAGEHLADQSAPWRRRNIPAIG